MIHPSAPPVGEFIINQFVLLCVETSIYLYLVNGQCRSRALALVRYMVALVGLYPNTVLGSRVVHAPLSIDLVPDACRIPSPRLLYPEGQTDWGG